MAAHKNPAILSLFVDVFKSFKIDAIIEPTLKYDPTAIVSIADLDELFLNNIYIKNPLNQKKLIEELESVQRSLAKPLTVWMTAQTQTLEFEAMLKARFESPGLFYGMLLDIDKATPSTSHKKITIEQVKTTKQANDFARIYCEAFHFPSLLDHTSRWAIQQYKMANPVCINYLARLDGMIAGASSLAIDHNYKVLNAGGLYNDCVLPQFRKAGIATAMANHRLNAAKELGLKYLSVVLMSDTMARGYCEKLGFINTNTMTPYFIK